MPPSACPAAPRCSACDTNSATCASRKRLVPNWTMGVCIEPIVSSPPLCTTLHVRHHLRQRCRIGLARLAGAGAAEPLRCLCAGDGHGDAGGRAAAVAVFVLQRRACAAHLCAAVPADRPGLAGRAPARAWRRRRRAAAVGAGGGGAAGHERLGPVRVSGPGAAPCLGAGRRYRRRGRRAGAVAALQAAAPRWRSTASWPAAFAYCSWLALRAARHEDNVGHLYVAAGLCHLPAAVHAVPGAAGAGWRSSRWATTRRCRA